MEIKMCNSCTYNEPIKMRKRDGFWWGECPRCGKEFWKLEAKEKEVIE